MLGYGMTTDFVMVPVAPLLSVTVRVRLPLPALGKVWLKLDAVETVLPFGTVHLKETMVPSESVEVEAKVQA